jgi:hypothetical protein
MSQQVEREVVAAGSLVAPELALADDHQCTLPSLRATANS